MHRAAFAHHHYCANRENACANSTKDCPRCQIHGDDPTPPKCLRGLLRPARISSVPPRRRPRRTADHGLLVVPGPGQDHPCPRWLHQSAATGRNG